MPHSFTRLSYHCIFGTKGRRPLITDDIRDRLYGYVGGILQHHHGQLIRAGGTADHVHLLIELDAVASVADTMRLVKANSSKWLRETFAMECRDFGWQTGYAAFSVSLSAMDDVKRYIENQQEHHRTKSFEEEFVDFIKRYGLEFDSQRIWE